MSTLENAIATAVAAHDKADSTNEGQPVVSATSEQGGEPEIVTEPKTEQPAGMTAEELVQAQQLYQALKDPGQAPLIIKFMAEQTGLLAQVKTPETKAEVKEEIVDVLKESLGPEFDFLADKLAPAIDKILGKKLAESTQDIRQRLAEEDESRLKTESMATIEELALANFGGKDIPEDYMADMSKLMDEMPPTPEMSVGRYLKIIFNTVAGERGLVPVKKFQTDKVETNRNDAPSRLASGRAGTTTKVESAPKAMSLDAAVKAAVESLSEKG